MAILACQPCLTSVLGPAALGAVGLSAVKKSKKTKKTKKKKKSKSSKKGGSGYETQEEYNLMNNLLFNEKSREEEMKKECSDFMKYVIKHRSKSKQKEYANQSFKHKQKCENGNLESCDFCRKEYLKLLFEDERPKSRSKLKSKSRSTSKSRSRSRSRSRSKSKSRSTGGSKKKKVNRNYKKVLERNLSNLGL